MIAVEELSNKTLEFLSAEWVLEIDELFSSIKDYIIEQDYYSLFELYEEIFDDEEKQEVLESSIEFSNGKLVEFYSCD